LFLTEKARSCVMSMDDEMRRRACAGRVKLRGLWAASEATGNASARCAPGRKACGPGARKPSRIRCASACLAPEAPPALSCDGPLRGSWGETRRRKFLHNRRAGCGKNMRVSTSLNPVLRSLSITSIQRVRRVAVLGPPLAARLFEALSTFDGRRVGECREN
jgi:hypothetical protein